MKSSLPPLWHHIDWNEESARERVSSHENSYKELSPAALYTAPEDFLTLFSHPEVSGTFVDLGCGTGQGCVLYNLLYPERIAVGIEWEEARIAIGKKVITDLGLSNVELLCNDLLKSKIPEGDVYFLYFPTGPVLDKVLFELYESTRDFKVIAIESHGDLLKRLSFETWLSLIAEVPLSSTRHYPNARIYQRLHTKRADTFFDYSFREKFLLVKEKDEIWIGESQGLEFLDEKTLNLLLPPRTIFWSSVVGILNKEDLPVEVKPLIDVRRLGEVGIETLHHFYQGTIRKIYVAPTFQLEISTGEKVEWKDIKTIRKGNLLCYDSSLGF